MGVGVGVGWEREEAEMKCRPTAAWQDYLGTEAIWSGSVRVGRGQDDFKLE